TTKTVARANWNHQTKLYFIGLLRQYDLPRFRTQNAWSKEAWTMKQKEQDLKKDEYRVVKELSDESGFGWNSNRKMVTALDSVWKSPEQRRNKDALLRWRPKSFPYYDDLYALYDGCYAEGRSCYGMDNYANKAKKSSEVPASPSPQLHVTEGPLQSTLPTQSATAEFSNKEPSVPEQFQGTQCQTSCPSSSTPEAVSAKRVKRQKTSSIMSTKDFQESINKCVAVLEGLLDLQMEEMIKAADIFKDNSANRETFLSFSRDETWLGWLRK
uniref:Myb/SANT-like domain-containing protein n=1 Tax=Setaria italica TaxID=4555 RepID=K3YZN2_SETIT